MNQFVDEIIAELAETVKPLVEAIEANPCPDTRNNYGAYLSVLSQFADRVDRVHLMALALKKAGANAQGVDDALRVSF